MGNGVGDLVTEGWDVAWLPWLNPALPQFPPRALHVTCALPGLVAFGFAKESVRFGVELNTLLFPSWGGGGICSPPLHDECPRSPSPQVQGILGRAVAAMALPPTALLDFLLAASPEHRLPPPRPHPGVAAAAACSIIQGLARAGRGRRLGGTRSPSLFLPHAIKHQNPRIIK